MFFDDTETEKFTAPPDFDGPTKNRHCTDILCFALIVAMWISMTGIGIYAVQNGDYRLVLYPLDYDGNICGTIYDGVDMTAYPNLLYVNLYTGGVCVKECPDLTGHTADNLTDIRTLVTYNGTWQPNDGADSELPLDFVQVADYSKSNDSIACTDATCYPNNSPNMSWTSPGIFMGYSYAYYVGTTYELLFRCILTSEASAKIKELVNANVTETEAGNAVSNTIDQAYSFWNKLYADLYIARWYIAGFGFGVSLAVSLSYIALMRFPGLLTTVIWTSIFITIALFMLGGYYTYNQATKWDNANPQTVDDTTINATRIFGIIFYCVGAFCALMACCLRKAIMEAIVCTKEAGKAVNTMTIILLVPIAQSIGFFIFFVPFIWYSINLASMATITTTDIPVVGGAEISIRTYEFDDTVRYLGWYMLFCLYWTANFIVAVGDMIIATSVAKWYFSRNKMLIGSWTVLFSIWEVLFYHSGTCAFGSLLVAIVQLIRTIIAKAQKKAKESGSRVAQILLCCCQCFFWCLECCLKFINKNAYIQTAIFSTSFCTSCRESFGLIFRNAARIGAVSYVSAAVLIVGKLFISSVVTLLAYYFMQENISSKLYSIGGPIAIIFLISYWISDMFMDVLDMGILTCLHCFIADEEMFEHEERYHDKELKDYVDKHGGSNE